VQGSAASSGPEIFKAVLTGSVSSDNKFIVTGSEDNTAELWDAETGRPLYAFLHGHEVFKTLFAPKGDKVSGDKILTVSGVNGANGGDSTVTLWDSQTHSLLCAIPIHGALFDAGFSQDGRRILTAGGNSAVMWDMATGKPVQQFSHRGDVYRVMTNAEGDRILTCSADGTAKLWDANSGEEVKSFQHGGRVLDAVFSPDSRYILTVGDDKTAKLWAIKTGKMLIPPFQHDDFVTHAVFSKKGTCILTISGDSEVDLWETESGSWETEKVTRKRLPRLGKVQTAVFSPDGQSILTSGGDNIVRLWDRENTKLLSGFVHDAAATDATFSNDGAHILTVCSTGAELWDTNTPELICKELKSKDKTGERLLTEIETLAKLVTGCTISEEGLPVALPDKDEAAKVKAAELLNEASDIGPGPNQRFVQWFLSDHNGLTIFPDSNRRVTEWGGKNKTDR
jgi:WD40 repeat protein